MQKPYTRYNNVHAPKRQLLGSQAQFVKPAWKPNVQTTGVAGSVKGKEVQGSKIFISGLPHDVGEKEIEVGAQACSFWTTSKRYSETVHDVQTFRSCSGRPWGP